MQPVKRVREGMHPTRTCELDRLLVLYRVIVRMLTAASDLQKAKRW